MPGKALIIDDDADLCELLEIFLSKRGCEVTVRNDPTRGLTAFRNGKPDLVMLDVNMPHGGGKLLYDTLCGDPQFDKIPLIIMTGAGNEGAVRSLVEAGPHASTWMMSKPFDMERLAGLLTKLGF